MKTGSMNLQQLAAEVERRANAKRDFVCRTTDMAMVGAGRLNLAGREQISIGSIAHEQIAEATGIPKKYYDKMAAEAPDLLANNVNAWFAKYPKTRMVRALDGQARAFLSDSYRPLENEDLAQAALPALMDLGLDIMSSEITDRRFYIKAVDPKVSRELGKAGAKFGDGGHTIVRVASPAITISNSEVGHGALSIMAGIYDSFCSNLATFGERKGSMRRYHAGARHELLGEDVFALLSKDTRELTDKALWAQVGEVIRLAFDRARFDELVSDIEGTREQKIEGNPVKVVELTRKKFSFSEETGAGILRALIEGAELNRFGLYNAVTRASQEVADYDEASRMERIGGQLIELPAAEWKELAHAA